MEATKPPATGVCIVMVEQEPDHLLITVRTNRNLDRHLYSARPETVRTFAHVPDALDAAAEFLGSFEDR
jgi:hypothetical protein